MYKSVDINSVTDHVKNIFDGSRCNVCDKHDGRRLRYFCGHTSCEECAQFGSCSLCLTPPGLNSSKPVVDEPLTQRADSARRLLESFEESFNLDVVKRQRLSEQLKVEKELFPQCIQAPLKYYNKRKSYQSLKANKENKSISLPGQEISRKDLKMENSNKNVHEWLNKYVKRKPFSELDPNQTLWRNEKQMTHSNSPMFTELKAQKNISRTSKKRKSDSSIFVEKPKISKILKSKKQSMKVNDESGIVLDDDEIDDEAVIVIDDSQKVIDKDKEALLAVEEAEKKRNDSQSIDTTFFDSASQDLFKKNLNNKETVLDNENYTDSTKNVILSENNDVTTKVSKIPFYKKAYLTEICKYCKEATDSHSKQFEDVSITIDSKSFITVIKVSQIDNYLNNKQSIQVQTDTTENKTITKEIATAIECNIKTNNATPTDIENNFNAKKTVTNAIENNINNNTKNTESPDIESKIDKLKVDTLPLNQDSFKSFVKKDDTMKLVNKSENVIIEESDTDSDVDLEASTSLEVTAEVHRSCGEMDYNILNSVDNIEEHSKRPRRAARGNTPNSTDSSDKENYNPNRMRKTNISAKKKSKK